MVSSIAFTAGAALPILGGVFISDPKCVSYMADKVRNFDSIQSWPQFIMIHVTPSQCTIWRHQCMCSQTAALGEHGMHVAYLHCVPQPVRGVLS